MPYQYDEATQKIIKAVGLTDAEIADPFFVGRVVERVKSAQVVADQQKAVQSAEAEAVQERLIKKLRWSPNKLQAIEARAEEMKRKGWL